MKIHRLFCLIIAVVACSLFSARAAEEIAKDQSPAYISAIQNAMRSFSARDFKTVLTYVDQAETIHQKSALTLNIRAAVAIEEKRFEEGRELLLQALQLDPRFFPALFNLAEIPFMQGKYSEARLAYEKLTDDDATAELIRFRIYLTYLLEKNDERAKAILDALPLLNDTPIYFYAHAAWEFAHGNTKDAQSYLKSAEAVFPPSRLANFADVFYDLGWLKRAPADSARASE